MVPFAMAILDVPVATWVHHAHFSSATYAFLRIVRWPGHYGFTLVLATLMIWRSRSHRIAAATLLLAGAVASAITAVIKVCCGRSRPFHGRAAFQWKFFAYGPISSFSATNLSFPSGDATLAFATAAVIARVAPRWGLPGYLWATAVAITRVLQGAHYPSDVIAGAVIGIATADVLTRMFGRSDIPWRRDQDRPR